MLNQTVIVGRLVKDPELKVTDSGRKVTNITLAVPRSFKNSNGIYDTDYIDCTLWTGIAESTSEYCQKGDMIGIKGRLQTGIVEFESGDKKKITEIIAEKVTFLSSKSNHDSNGTTKNSDNNISNNEQDINEKSEKSKK